MGSGWDTCGKYLSLELSKMCDVSIVTTSPITPEHVGNELEYLAVNKIPVNSVHEQDFDRQNKSLKGLSIRTLNDMDLGLWLEEIQSEKKIGYTFYLGTPLGPKEREAAKTLDLIIGGSSFCEERLREKGIENTRTIIQGVDPQIYNACYSTKSILQDRFVIFSGGKFEFRKGQDIVLKAFQVFSDRHPDVILINAWFNQWEFSLNTMFASRLIDFRFKADSYMKSMADLLRVNGIDPEKVITLPMKSPYQLAHIFKNTDIGLFPNRCEGGTNLMLMEYMACGKPVIATTKTGHSDIIDLDSPFAITRYGPVHPRKGHFSEYTQWVEPDLDEIIGLLEMAYDNPEKCRQEGIRSGERLTDMTWKKAARSFYDIAQGLI